MFARRSITAAAALALVAGCTTTMPAVPPPDPAPAQRAFAASCTDFDEWDKPAPPFRLHGDTYYVGTCGIAALLITDARGHTLIDSGTDRGAEVVLANIRALGFDPRDVTTILMSHEHFDHVGGLARVQAATGATIAATAPAAAVLRTGITAEDDPQAQSGHDAFPPFTGPIRLIDPAGEQGRFTPIATPGHTRGAVSWRWQSCETGACRWIVYADSMNPISDDLYRFSDHPGLVAGFRTGIAALAASPCDILITPHPGGSALRRRLLGEAPLVNPDGCRAYAASVTSRLDARLAEEATRAR